MFRIVHLTSVHPVFDPRIFYKECKTLVKVGYDVTLIAPYYADDKVVFDNDEGIIDNNELINGDNKTTIIDGIKIVWLPKPHNRFFRIFFLTRIVYRLALKQKADIYHFHDPELLPWMWLLKKKTGAKIIYDVHEDLPKDILIKEWIPGIVRHFIVNIVKQFEKFASRKFDFIVTATPDISKNFKLPNVVDIKNYPVLDDFKIFKDPIFPKNKDHYNLIYIGVLDRNRGIKEIINSLNFINPQYNIKLTLIGRFFDKDFKEEIKKLEKSAKVNFLGWLFPKDAYKYLLESDIGMVCLHPLEQFSTSLPVKMFEYMAAGLPVIASNFSLWKEIIEANKCGICVNPLEPRDIARAIEYLIENPKTAKEMEENGKKAILEKYNWEEESKKLIKTYQRLLNE